MLFERTALSKRPAALARKELAKLRDEDQLTPDLVFRDPYVLDFLRLKKANPPPNSSRNDSSSRRIASSRSPSL